MEITFAKMEIAFAKPEIAFAEMEIAIDGFSAAKFADDSA